MKVRQNVSKIDQDLLTLQDGTVWRVDPSQETVVKLWSAPFDEVELEPSLATAELKNVQKLETVTVMRVN